MKKKFAFFILLSRLVLYGASSQQLKSYSDYRNGFAGLASAKYQGMIYSINHSMFQNSQKNSVF